MKNPWLAGVACGLGLLTCFLGTTGARAEDAPSSAAAPSAVVASKGKMLASSNGARLGAVYRVMPDGAVQIIIDGKMVTVPAATLSMADGKLTTSLTKSEVLALH